MKLKNSVAGLIIALGAGITANAQVREADLKKYSNDYYEWGARAGANFQQLAAFPFSKDYNTGGFGGFYVKRRKNSFGIQLEVNVSNASYTTEYPVGHDFTLTHIRFADSTTKGKFDALYLNVPLMLEVRPGNHFAFQFGAQYSYLLSNKDNNGMFTGRYRTADIFNKGNVSVLTGIEIDVCKDFRLGARYAVGLSDVDNKKFTPFTDKWQINSGQVFLTYRISKWGIKI